MTQSVIELNGFVLHFSGEQFTANVADVPETTDVRALREQFDEWFLHWSDGRLYGLARVAKPTRTFGVPVRLKCQDHLRLLAARVADVLPQKFPKYEAFRRRPFTFLGLKDEIVASVSEKLKSVPALLSSFEIRPKFELDAKLVELRDGEPFIGLFVQAGTRWEIKAPLHRLAEAGIDLHGMHVVRRNPDEGERRLVGRVGRLDGQKVVLSESYEDLPSVSADEVWVEGSKATFTHCLRVVLGSRYDAFERARYAEEARFLTGPAVDELLAKMSSFLTNASSLGLATDLLCSVGKRIRLAQAPDYKTVISAAPVAYCFDAARTKQSGHPWTGLVKYGPYSRDTFPNRSPRIAVFFPDTIQGQTESFLRAFRDGVSLGQGRSQYAGGFAQTFGLVNPEFTLWPIPWLAASRTNPASAYRQAVEQFLGACDSSRLPDAAIVAVLDDHKRLSDSKDPYLTSKALLLMAGVPSQIVEASTLSLTPESLQYILQNVAIGLYAKLSGTPWTVDHDLTISDELVIGMGAAELAGSRFISRQRFVGITTVFRGDGNYLLSNLSRECSYDEYPQMLRETTTEILREIKERNGWRQGDTVRIVVHAYKPLRNVEVGEIVSECTHQIGAEQTVQFAFLTVSQDHPFLMLDRQQQGVAVTRGGGAKAVFVPERGTIAQLGRYTRLLSTNGPKLVKRESSPLPAPLLVHLHKQSTYRDQAYLNEQVLKFTALSWRSTHPAARPVTIYYSELIAGLLARMRSVPDWSPALLNARLRSSRWFL